MCLIFVPTFEEMQEIFAWGGSFYSVSFDFLVKHVNGTFHTIWKIMLSAAQMFEDILPVIILSKYDHQNYENFNSKSIIRNYNGLRSL